MNLNQLILGLFLLMLFACSGEATSEKQTDLLVGRWDLIEGKRDGKVTESLKGTYFEFSANGKMSTNLPIKGGTNSPYKVKDNVIHQTIINDLVIQYTIDILSLETLELSTTLRRVNFNFSMERSKTEALSAR